MQRLSEKTTNRLTGTANDAKKYNQQVRVLCSGLPLIEFYDGAIEITFSTSSCLFRNRSVSVYAFSRAFHFVVH